MRNYFYFGPAVQEEILCSVCLCCCFTSQSTNFSVTLGRFPVFLGLTSPKQRKLYLAQVQIAMPQLSHIPVTLQSQA